MPAAAPARAEPRLVSNLLFGDSPALFDNLINLLFGARSPHLSRRSFPGSGGGLLD